MKWTNEELVELGPILDRIDLDLGSLDGKEVLVLCSASGDIAFHLARKMRDGHILGLELNKKMLSESKERCVSEGLERTVEFRAADERRIPFPSSSFHLLVSEFVMFPTSSPTLIGQPEMARVLKHGGTMVLTDVILTRAMPKEKRDHLLGIGLDYLCDGTVADFYEWMTDAGLRDVEVSDVTEYAKNAWKKRVSSDPSGGRNEGYSVLFNDVYFGLGRGIFYIYVKGTRP